MKNKAILVLFFAALLVSCRSSRFMQDDMYFTDMDASREVREHTNKLNWLETQANALVNTVPPTEESSSDNYQFDYRQYYDYQYSSRFRRFHTINNTWSYYDPHFTNYYWYNPSKTYYFGQSLYATYTWWGPNFGNNYDHRYWEVDKQSKPDNWLSLWQNNSLTGWWNPYYPLTFSSWNNPAYWHQKGYYIGFNKGLCYNHLYYNSYDNNCYPLNTYDEQYTQSTSVHFSSLMQKGRKKKYQNGLVFHADRFIPGKII